MARIYNLNKDQTNFIYYQDNIPKINIQQEET